MDNRADFMPRVGQDIAGSLGAALQAYVQARWPRDTAKQCARTWGLDHETGKNIAKGHASPRTLAHAVKADGYAVLDALGLAITGVTRAEWERERINILMGKLEIETAEYEALRASAAAIEAALASLPSGLGAKTNAIRPDRR